MGIWYDKKAYELLKKCSDTKDLTEWNEYRKATNYAPINLRFANLRNFYLQKADLQNIDFRGAILEKANLSFSNVNQANISINIYKAILTVSILIGFCSAFLLIHFLLQLNFNLSNKQSIFISIFGSLFGIFYLIIGSVFSTILKGTFGIAVSGIFFGGILGGISAIVTDISDFNIILLILFSIIFFQVFIFDGDIVSKWQQVTETIATAKNAEEAIGFNSNYLKNTIISVVDELQKEVLGLSKVIETTQDDETKQKLLIQQKKLEDKIQFYSEQEKSARPQKVQIENVITELQLPYKYIHQTITKIEWYNRFYYCAIIVFIGIFIYAIAHGYVDQKMATFSSLFTKETLPSFESIFGVILFYGSPVLIGISLIIYFITQINKNNDKITELQEQERNIKQIASTIKAKAQVGMSDEEFIKETKNLIQKYQEGMMESMFTKEKITDKEDKSSSPTYREKLIANSMSKLLMQAIKSK